QFTAIFDPAIAPPLGGWIQTTADPVATTNGRRSALLPDGRVLFAGAWGSPTSYTRANLWRPGPPPATACLPFLGAPGNGLPLAPWPTGATVIASGGRLLGCGEGGSG